MALISPQPKLQFMNAAGEPLVGGKLYTYAAGTTTPLATYTNSGGGTANANPVILDTRGEADVWLTSGSSYKFVLKDANDTTLWTVDNLLSPTGTVTSVAALTLGTSGNDLSSTVANGTTTPVITLQVPTASATKRGALSSADWTTFNTKAGSGVNTDITALDQDVAITATGTIAADSIGFRGLPQNAQSASYTLALSDAGKHISITTGGVVIPANSSVAFPIGTTIVLYNNSGSTQALTITTDTLRQSGTTNTGARTISTYGLATIVKVASTTWVVSGSVV